jgi:sensor histidine kinase YesM
MRKNKSFIRVFIIYLLILTTLMLMVVGIFSISSIGILVDEIKETSEAFLTIYSNEMENSIKELDVDIKSVASQKEDLAKIKSKQEKEQSLAAISLHSYLKQIFVTQVEADAIVIYENKNHTCLDMVNSSVSFSEKQVLREYTKSTIEDSSIVSGEWDFITLNGQIYFLKILKTKEHAIAVYKAAKNISNALDDDNGNRSILVVNEEGLIGKIWGVEDEAIQVNSSINNLGHEKYYLIKRPIVNGQLEMFCLKSKSDLFKQASVGMITVFLITLITLGFIIYLIRYIQKEIIRPMQSMMKDLKQISDGDYQNRIEANFNTNEFEMLKDVTNHMVDEIIGLKIQTYEKQIQLQDMELQSIRLQLKPHFFLNALTTISSLNSQNQRDKITSYINSLSKNVRYLFRAGLYTVTISEEVRHVIHYFEMQELKYPNAILYFIDLPKELEDWRIPQLLIHTFIENEYKYAVSIDEPLTLLIKISKQKQNQENMLLIEIEDDGKGYPQEVLDYLNGITQNPSEKGTRVGLWSIKNMLELMYERKNLLVVQNIKPHGCLNQIYIPIKPKHERLVDHK